MTSPSQRTLSDLVTAQGHSLPPVVAPTANYVSTRRADRLLYVSGQISIDAAGAPSYFGRLGERIDASEGYRAAQSCALGVLAQLNHVIHGDVSRVRQVQRLGVFVAATPEFVAHSQIANGASDLMVNVLGESGKHARTAVGVASLPRGVAVEVDAIIELV
jgi:enamine deaminase RidA (YjgF/YER057c/UK114 family)